jgi:hypothetical protein
VSYEGYTEYLCARGHRRVYDCWDDVDSHTCSCGAKFVFQHMVDQTNGEDLNIPATLPYPFRIATPETTCRCSTCGHVHMMDEPIYEIPGGAVPNA